MKRLPIILAIIAIIVVGTLVFFWITAVAEEFKTEIEVVYTDGSTHSFKILGVTFGGEEVDHINLKVSTKINDTGFDTCSVDLTQFYVLASLEDSDGLVVWYTNVYGDISTVSVDQKWHYIYETTVTSSDFDLELGDYNLSFIPMGTIYMQGLPDGTQYEGKLPLSRWAIFTVATGAKWINVELGSDIETENEV